MALKKEMQECGVVHELPSHCGASTEYPDDIIGARILRIGYPDTEEFWTEDGGLVIDYIPDGGGPAKRMVLWFNELGMGLKGTCEAPDLPADER